MKGFTFEIKNNLLEPKHIEAMGIAIWLFMWLDDKVTRIDDGEVGWILGGKPIKYEQVKEELGISQRTYTRWIEQLVKYPYIKAIRTPHGISFRIYKAHKSFGKRSVKSGVLDKPQVANLLDKSGVSNKTITIDNNSKTKEATLPLWLNKKAWEAWLKYNKEKKKKMPTSTIEFQIKRLEKWKHDHIEIIYRSIENGWTGLFPLKKDYGNGDAGKVLKRRIEDDEDRREREVSAGDDKARNKIMADIKNLAKEKTI